MEDDRFNNMLLNNRINIADYDKNFNINDKTDSIYLEKISILKNDKWQYDTYIKDNKSITKSSVKKLVKKLEKDYDIKKIDYEFYGGQPMGTQMVDYREIEGYHVWIVYLTPNVKAYLKNTGYLNELEDEYNLIGGFKVKDIKNFFFLEDKKFNSKYFKDILDIHTMYDGNMYYTNLSVYKDGNYIDKLKIESNNNPIIWEIIHNKISEINKNKKFYGYIYKLTYTFNNGLVLETTNDKKFDIDI